MLKYEYSVSVNINFVSCVCVCVFSVSAFTPDATCANKSRYLRVVGRLNILSLLASFARQIHLIRAWKSLHNRCEFTSWEGLLQQLPCWCLQSLQGSLWRGDCNRRNHVTIWASSWLVNAQFVRIASFVPPHSRELRRRMYIASMHWLIM